MTALPRISHNPNVMGGKPCIRGMRYPVVMILELLASGMSHSEILVDYPDLVEDDILACLQYAAKLSDCKNIQKVNL